MSEENVNSINEEERVRLDFENQPDLKSFLEITSTYMQSIFARDHRENHFDSYDKPDLVSRNTEELRLPYHEGCNTVARVNTVRLLHAKLLQHKWGDAAMLLVGLIEQHWKNIFLHRSKYSTIMWKVGKDVILNHPYCHDDSDLIIAQKESMEHYFEHVDHINILIEHIFMFLSSKKFVDARENLVNYGVLRKSIVKKERRMRDTSYWTPVAEAYLGMIGYAFWRQMIAEESNCTAQDSSEMCSDPARESHEKVAEAASQHFRKIFEKRGVWDIFMLKHVEMFLNYYRMKELQRDLVVYSERNLQNPNAHIYLYQYLRSYIGNDPEDNIIQLKITALKRLHSVSPSDQLMLNLHQLLFDRSFGKLQSASENTKVEGLFESFEVLMHLLDFVVWMNAKQPWLLFQRNLSETENKSHPDIFKSLTSKLWNDSGRDTWWPHMHFSVSSLNDSTLDSELLEAKAFIASIFLSPNCEFCNAVRQLLIQNVDM